MLKCSTSLWSADLANLESEMKRVEPLRKVSPDVADGHYVKNLLFFRTWSRLCGKHTRCHLSPFDGH
jgi:pentose-5-phosphate-3-epimerase